MSFRGLGVAPRPRDLKVRWWFARHHDVGLDGERFLMLSMKGTDEDRTRINVVLNWGEELKRLVPTR